MGQLHFLGLFAHHHEQHKAEHDTGEHQHFSVRQSAVGNKREHGYDAGAEQAEPGAGQQNGPKHPLR